MQKAIDQGAVVLGKCNMGEFALSPDESTGSVFGIVRNPYDLDHTTAGYLVAASPSALLPLLHTVVTCIGLPVQISQIECCHAQRSLYPGSSGGGAAAVAANLALLSLGTDTGNSIRGPAAHCSVVGLRPSLGVTSR